jgi:hypothetical protein
VKPVEMVVTGQIAANPEIALKNGMSIKTCKDNVEQCYPSSVFFDYLISFFFRLLTIVFITSSLANIVLSNTF